MGYATHWLTCLDKNITRFCGSLSSPYGISHLFVGHLCGIFHSLASMVYPTRLLVRRCGISHLLAVRSLLGYHLLAWQGSELIDSVGYPMYMPGSHSGISHSSSSPSPWDIPCAQWTTYMRYPTHLQDRLCGISHLFVIHLWGYPICSRPIAIGISHSFT
jgi:hypothetical protein